MTTAAIDTPLAAEVLRDLAPTGVLRAAINLGNSVLAQRGTSGDLAGVSVDLARELGRRLGVAVEPVVYDAAGQVVQGLETAAWDVAFLAVDPARAAQIAFTPPYLLIAGAYLVCDDSPLTDATRVDRDGTRVATGAGSAYDLFLTRHLRHARIERRATAREAFALLDDGTVDVAAGVRQVVERHARTRGGLRVLQPDFMVIEQAMGMPAGRTAGERHLAAFLRDATASGFVAEALRRSGQHDAAVAH